MKSGSIGNFAGYSQFESLKEFNNSMEMWMAAYKEKFTKGELVGLKRLVRFAAKIPGVCNAKIATVLKAIHEDYGECGISRSTFKRMILKAKEIGIFTVHETERKNGSQSSNLYVFLPFAETEPPKEEIMDHHNKTSIPFKTKISNIKKREEPRFSENEPPPVDNFEPKDYEFVSDRVPKDFTRLVKCFYPNAKTIEEFWRMSGIIAYRNCRENEQNTVLETSLDAFKQLIRKIKTRMPVKNPIAYFTGILNKKYQEMYFEELYAMEFADE
ncbi:hypothetical protein [Bacillus massilinigeriensis]|uniref:hypothetical protein n=1 Tax=Bacillus mediterraneensis TaxID=1805474 RepID=UPI001F22F385|nr:hypothetical protein [Bacillus mediterraneensis]